jgi:hypothetical protein
MIETAVHELSPIVGTTAALATRSGRGGGSLKRLSAIPAGPVHPDSMHENRDPSAGERRFKAKRFAQHTGESETRKENLATTPDSRPPAFHLSRVAARS